MIFMNIKKVTLLAVHDSYLKSLLPIAAFLKQQGVVVKLCISNLISERIIEQAKPGKYEVISVTNLQKGKWKQDSEVVIIGAGGSDLVKIAANTNAGIIKISLFPGITSQAIYKGFDDRLGTDVVLLNTEHDLKKLELYLHDARVASCTPFLLGYSYITKIEHVKGQDVVYFEQNFPSMSYSEKAYILEKLIKLARADASRKVIIKLRNRQGEETPHKAMYRIEDIMKKAGKRVALPQNLVVSYDSVEVALQNAGLAISVSSAAIIEALYNNVPSVIINDFGIRADFGNYAFSGSGIYTSLDEVIAGNIPSANMQWVQENIVPAASNYPKLLEFLNNMAGQQNRIPAQRKSLKKDVLKEVLAQKNIYGGMALHKERLTRKYKKFKNSPRIFFEDSRNVFIKPFAKIFK